MDCIQLDELVLINCASYLDFVNRIRQELVGQCFASALRSANKECEISLTIRHDEIETPEKNNQQFQIIAVSGSTIMKWICVFFNNHADLQDLQHRFLPADAEGNDSSQKSDETAKNFNNIHHILMEIFSRFKHFKRITFLPYSVWVRLSIDFVLNILSMEDFQSISVKKLVYSTGGYCHINSFQITQRDCDLIETLSPTLEEFVLLVGNLPESGSELSVSFWTAMSTCRCLKKLYFSRTCKTPNIFLTSDMRDCLKLLNIREFHVYESNQKILNTEWICDSFKNNKKLRKLFINDFDSINEFSCTTVLPIISRLRAVEITFDSFNDDDLIRELPKIRKILQTLPKEGYLSAEHLIYPPNASEEVNASVKALSFWLRLSNETKKSIRLYARVILASREVVAISYQAIDALTNGEEFAGMRIEHGESRSSISFQFNDASVSLYYRLLAFKPYLTEEFVNCNCHVR